jgi:hypothetical protein
MLLDFDAARVVSERSLPTSIVELVWSQQPDKRAHLLSRNLVE